MNRSTSQYYLICNVSNDTDRNSSFQQWPINLTSLNCIPKPRPQKDDFIDILTTGYLFLILFIIGVLGNLLNLMVLNIRHMKSKTNTFLSAMALADLAFFISNLPRCLNTFKFFASSQISKKYYVKTMPLFLMVGNAFSCSSIWVAVTVTIERFIAIKLPLKAKLWWKKRNIRLTILVIFAASLLTNCYNLTWLTPTTFTICGGGEKIYGLKRVDEKLSPRTFQYVQAMLLISPILTIILPTILLMAFNSILIYYLYKHKSSMENLSAKNQNQQNNESKVTCTVVIIVFSFVLLTFPSAALYAYDWIATNLGRETISVTYNNLVKIANLLVAFNKALNFILYCGVSQNFRHHLIRLILPKKLAHKRKSTCEHSRRMTTTQITDFQHGELTNFRKTTNQKKASSASRISARKFSDCYILMDNNNKIINKCRRNLEGKSQMMENNI